MGCYLKKKKKEKKNLFYSFLFYFVFVNVLRTTGIYHAIVRYHIFKNNPL